MLWGQFIIKYYRQSENTVERTPDVGMAQKKMAAHTASDAEISANIIETSLNKHIPFDI